MTRVAFIRTIGEDEADRELAERYRVLADPEHGRVDAILRIHSLNPEGLDAHVGLYRSAMRSSSGLRKVDRELIALEVSRLNACHY